MNLYHRIHHIMSRTAVGALLFSTGAPVILSTQSAFARSLPTVTPADLGFQKSETLDSSLRKTITLKDPTTGHTLQTTYSSLGKIEFQLETTASGQLLSRRELRTTQEVQEQFVPVHMRTILQTKRPGWITIEKTTWINGNENTVSYEIREKTALGICDTESSSSQIDRLLADMSWLSFRPETTETSVPLGNNFVAENCASYPHGGVDGLARALTEGLKTGLSCLARFGAERKMDAAKLLAFLDEKAARKAKIRCGHEGDVTGRGEPDPDHPGKYTPMTIGSENIAEAYFPDSPDFPAIQLNLDAEDLKNSETQASQTFFHEMLHWLGYYHSEGFDVPYLSQICCFPTTNDIRKTQEHACQLLKDHPDFKSEEYHRRFTQVMDDSFHTSIGLEAAWSASRGRNDTSLLFASVIELANSYRSLYQRIDWNYREKGSPLYYIVLARTSLGSLPPEKKKAATAQVADQINSVYPDGKIKDAALYLGDSLNALINHNAKAFKRSWTQFERIRASACSRMKQHEKEQFSRATDLAITDYFRMEPRLYGYYDKLKKPCP